MKFRSHISCRLPKVYDGQTEYLVSVGEFDRVWFSHLHVLPHMIVSKGVKVYHYNSQTREAELAACGNH